MTALVTGASAGIGFELAKLLAADKHRLVVVARNKELLENNAELLRNLGSPEVTVIPADLSKLGAAHEVYEQTRAKGIAVDILINNAGIGTFGPFEESDTAKNSAEMLVNIVALTELTRLYLPEMIASATVQKPSRVVFMSSIAGLTPGPYMAVYMASKAYVINLAESLHEEMRGKNVAVTLVLPGAVATGFSLKTGNFEAAYFKKGVMAPKPVAEAIYRAMLAGKKKAIPGFKNQVQALLLGFAPRSIVARVVRRMHGH